MTLGSNSRLFARANRRALLMDRLSGGFVIVALAAIAIVACWIGWQVVTGIGDV